MKAARELIECQQAEIGRLKDRNVELWGENRIAYKKAVSEARKEFAERLKEYGYVPHLSFTGEAVIDVEDIDNLLAEMESEGV